MPTETLLHFIAKALQVFIFSCFVQSSFAQQPLNVPADEAWEHVILATRVDPVYPQSAKASRIEGRVALAVSVNEAGVVTEVRAENGDRVFYPAAVNALRHWRYEPFVVNGKPAEVQTWVSFPFTLEKSDVSCRQKGPAETLAFSSDGHSLAILNCERGLAVWDLENRHLRFAAGGAARDSSLAFHPNSRWLAFVADDGKTVELWDAVSGKELRGFYGQETSVYAVSFLNKGSEVASVGSDGTVKIWDTATGRQLQTSSSGTMHSAAFSPDGRVLATTGSINPAGSDLDDCIKLWDVAGGRLLNSFRVGIYGRAMAFSRDGALLAETGEERDPSGKTFVKRIKIYEVAGGHVRQSMILDDHFFPASLAFSPDGRWLALGGEDKGLESVSMWDVESGRQLLHAIPEGSADKSVAFSPDGEWLAYATRNFSGGKEVYTVELHNVAEQRKLPGGSSELVLREGEPNRIDSLALAGDGSKLVSASSDGTLRLWNAGTGRLNNIIRTGGWGAFPQPALSPNGKLLAAAVNVETENDHPGQVVKVWDAETGAELHTFEVPEAAPDDLPDAKPAIASVIFSPDGRRLALGGFCKVVLLDLATGRERRTLTVSPGTIEKLRKQNALVDMILMAYLVTNMTFSPDGKQLAVVTLFPSALQLWDTGSGQKLKEIVADPGGDEHLLQRENFGIVRFGTDGRLYAMKGRSMADLSTARLITYDTSLQEIHNFPASGVLYGFSSGTNGGLVIQTHDHEFAVLEPATGKVRRTMRVDLPDTNLALAISGDGDWLATVDDSNGQRSMSLWDLSTGRHTNIAGIPLQVLHWDEKPLVAAQRLASGSPPAEPPALTSSVPAEAGEAVAALPAPSLLSPPDGQVFDSFPRHTTVTWNPVPAADGYEVEWNCKSSRGWETGADKYWPVPLSWTLETHFSFDFCGAQPGRWRVWALDQKGNTGAKSEWREFRYTR